MKHNGRASRFLRARREDYIFQTLTGAAVSCGITALFALYNGYLGVQHGSIWHGSIAVFYLLLTAIRGTVLLTEQRNRTRRKTEQEQCRRRTFRTSATLLLALDLALILPISMMTVLAKPVVMGLIPAIAMAAYTTWKIVMASIHIRRQRSRAQGSILIAAKHSDYGKADSDGGECHAPGIRRFQRNRLCRHCGDFRAYAVSGSKAINRTIQKSKPYGARRLCGA